MILLLKPPGRGNWSQITIAIEGRHAIPLAFKVGDLFTLADKVFRIARILPVTKVTIWKNALGQLEGVTDEDERGYQVWRRKVRNIEHGEMITFAFTDPKCPKHHARFILKIRNLFGRTEAFGNERDLRQWLIQSSGYVKWEPGPDSTPNALPISIKFSDLEEAEFIELHRAVDFVLWSAEGQAKLWPALDEEGRYKCMQSFMEVFE